LDEFAESLFDFVGEVARAATMEELERRYLDGVGRFLGSSAAGIYVINSFTHGAESIAARGVSDYFLSRYEEHGRHRDPVLARALKDLRATHSGALMTPSQWTRLPVYKEVFQLHGMTSLLEAPIVLDGSPVGTLNFGRTAEEPAFGEDERKLADAIARLLGTALGALRANIALARERDQIVAALELCADAVVVTDMRSAERRMNAAARNLLGRLEGGEGVFDELMINPLRRDGISRHETPVQLSDGASNLLVARSTFSATDESVMISFIELISEPEGRRVHLAAELTKRELEVAELAASGLRDAEIAGQLYLSPHTVKQYLKAVYSKLGVRSRVDLTRLIVGANRPPSDDRDGSERD
jgi:DNA-binding CsgD family transcriptional regulator/GAF domain-containing protein